MILRRLLSLNVPLTAFRMIRWSIAFVIGVATTLFLIGNVYILQTQGKYLKLTKLPKSDWLWGNSYLQLAALVDTFIPSYSANELDEEFIKTTLKNFGIYDNIANSPMDSKELLAFKRYLTAGALDFGTHLHIYSSITDNLTKSEKVQISWILFILGNSFLSWLLTGYPVTFSDLPLHIRESVLLSWRDSFFEPVRTLYQLFKRLVSVHFMAYLGEQKSNSPSNNPAWVDMGYDPDSSRQYVEASKHDDEEDQTLRLQMNIKNILSSFDCSPNQDGEFKGGEYEFSVDAIVVGSGCGGGVVAYNLVQKGYKVLVLEKSGYYNKKEFSKWREIEALGKSFDKAGMLSTKDANYAIFAGSCVGGGSTINWSASFSTPDYVLQDWAQNGMSENFDPKNSQSPFATAMKDVHNIFQINQDNSYYQENDTGDENCSFVVNENNRILWNNAMKEGYEAEKIPRNVKNCVDCGHCSYGCAHERKQSTVHTLLEPLLLAQGGFSKPYVELKARLAPGNGAVCGGNLDDQVTMSPSDTNHSGPAEKAVSAPGRLYVLPFCTAKEILMTSSAANNAASSKNVHKKKATGVLAVALDNEHTYTLRINSTIVCVCAGSIHTPALLLRSKLQHPGIGKGLCLHPVVPIAGFMTKDVDTKLANGVSMGVVVREPKIFNPATGDDCHPVALETPPGHPAIMSTVIPWQGGLLYKILMLQYKHIAAFVGIPRDRSQPSNRVDVGSDGEPIVHYETTRVDQDLIMAGIVQGLRFLWSDPRTAVLFVGHSSFPCFSRHPNEPTEVANARFEEYLRKLQSAGIQPMRTQLYSAHQISSVRMAASSDDGPVNPQGELFECENLFVADGSVLPTSLGINPMLTIEAMAHMIAQNVVQRLQVLNVSTDDTR